MREIKFRGFDKRDKKIKCVSDLNFDAQGRVYSVRFAFEDEYTLIDDVELIQYTNIKDKNDKEIYEGHIVKLIDVDNSESIGEVVFDKDNASFCIKEIDEDENEIECWEFLKLSVFRVEIEVIGNIFENPELLEQER